MKTPLLPHRFKMIGLIIFLLAFIPSFVAGVYDGFTLQRHVLLSKESIHYLDIIGMVGIILYAFSKDKVFDELLHTLKLEAIKVTFMTTLLLVILIHIAFPDYRIHTSYLVYLQMICFIAVYYYKKSNIIASMEAKQQYEQ